MSKTGFDLALKIGSKSYIQKEKSYLMRLTIIIKISMIKMGTLPQNT